MTTSPEKEERAKKLGADSLDVMSDEDAAEKIAASLDIALSTIPTAFNGRNRVCWTLFEGRNIGTEEFAQCIPGGRGVGRGEMMVIQSGAGLRNG